MISINTETTKNLLCMGLLAICLFVSACAHQTSDQVSDPYENVNRKIFAVNDTLDKAILEPVAKGYRAATPGFGRTMVRNFLRNLNSPTIIGNQLLQGDLSGAGNSSARAVINTLAGFGGILDLATEGGIEYEHEDFGQTLAVWGVKSGPYLMLPLMGPSNARDLAGNLVDGYADPLRTYLFNIDEKPLHYARVASSVVSKREELIEVIDDLRRNSFDYYAALRSAYNQRRQNEISDNQFSGDMMAMDYPDFD